MKALSCLAIVACVAGLSGLANAEESARDLTEASGSSGAVMMEAGPDVVVSPKIVRESRAFRRASRQLNTAMAQFRDLLDQPVPDGDVRVLAASR